MSRQHGEAFDSEIGGGSSIPFSFPSQPPDIRNWFSSYEYEPPPDSSEDPLGGGSRTEEAKLSSTQHDVPETEPDGHRSPDDRDRNWLLETWCDVSEEEPGTSPTRAGAVDGDGKGMGKELDVQFVPETECPQTWLRHGGSSDDDGLDGKSEESGQVGGAEKVTELTRNGISGDGFVSTKKRKSCSKSLNSRPPPVEEEDNDDDGLVLKEQRELGRVGGVLADRTNIQVVAPEAIGKWRCPRRSKPYVGPPLKQLRLERWVRRLG